MKLRGETSIYSLRGERRKVSKMNIYEMMDKFACEVREYLDSDKPTDRERVVGEDLYAELVSFITYYDGDE